MTHPEIRGEHTMLRPVTPSDLDLLTEWFADPEVYHWWDGYPKPRDEVAAKYIGRRRPEVESFIIEAGGAPIGYLHYWHGDVGTGGLDMFLIPSHREQGLGSDAARAAVRYLIEDLGWRRLTVDPHADNPRALRAWAKAGFRPEETLPEHPGGPAILMAIEAETPTGD
jgi:aminoglycoside 6'-N-acetyltransferase